METQTFLSWRASGCQVTSLYEEVSYADCDIFLRISCAQNKTELAGVGYPNPVQLTAIQTVGSSLVGGLMLS